VPVARAPRERFPDRRSRVSRGEKISCLAETFVFYLLRSFDRPRNLSIKIIDTDVNTVMACKINGPATMDFQGNIYVDRRPIPVIILSVIAIYCLQVRHRLSSVA